MVLTRARATEALQVNDYAMAMQQIEEGLEKIRAFCHEHARGETAEMGGEVGSLEAWLEEIRAKRPLSRREKLERALHEAINSEDYERAAQVRDQLRNLKPAD
jgi:protein-arginine kinase activator protein McsA